MKLKISLLMSVVFLVSCVKEKKSVPTKVIEYKEVEKIVFKEKDCPEKICPKSECIEKECPIMQCPESSPCPKEEKVVCEKTICPKQKPVICPKVVCPKPKVWTLNDFPEGKIANKCEEMGFNKFVANLRGNEKVSYHNYFDGSLGFSLDVSTAIGQTNNDIGKSPLMSFINLTGRTYWHLKNLELSLGVRFRYGIANQHTSIEDSGVNFRGNYWNIAGSIQKDFESFILTLDYVLSGSYYLGNTDVLGQDVEYTGVSGFGISALRPMKLFGMITRIGLDFELNSYNKSIAGSTESLADQTFSSLGLTVQTSF